MFRGFYVKSASLKSLHPLKRLQMLAVHLSGFFGCEKLLFTPLNQSLLQRLHVFALQLNYLWQRKDMQNLLLQICRQTWRLTSFFATSQICRNSVSVAFFASSIWGKWASLIVSISLSHEHCAAATCWSSGVMCLKPYNSFLHRFGLFCIFRCILQLHQFAGSPKKHLLYFEKKNRHWCQSNVSVDHVLHIQDKP